MKKPNVTVGLGVALQVNAGTSTWDYLEMDLKAQSIKPIERKKAHVALIGAKESEMEILSRKDEKRFVGAHTKVHEYLGSLGVHRWLLTPDHDRVKPFSFNRKKLGVIVAEQDHLCKVREDLKDILQEEAGITIEDERKFVGHATLGSVTREYREQRKLGGWVRSVLPPTPKALAVTGFIIEDWRAEAQTTSQIESLDLPPRFHNNPPSLRQVS